MQGTLGWLARHGNWTCSGFSAMPAGSGRIFSEGIAMALLTTIIGLAIAIPTLFMHSYLMRIIEKSGFAKLAYHKTP